MRKEETEKRKKKSGREERKKREKRKNRKGEEEGRRSRRTIPKPSVTISASVSSQNGKEQRAHRKSRERHHPEFPVHVHTSEMSSSRSLSNDGSLVHSPCSERVFFFFSSSPDGMHKFLEEDANVL